MDDLFVNTKPPRFDRRTAALLAFVVAYAIFDLFCSGFNGPIAWHRRILVGIWMSQAILTGAWTAIGPPPAVKRVPLTNVALLILTIVSSLNQPGNPHFAEGCLIVFGLSAGAALTTWVVGWRAHWQIASREAPAAAINQFSLKYMIGLMTIIGITLALSRTLTKSDDSISVSNWSANLLRLIRAIGLILMGMLPLLTVPIVVLSRRPAAKTAVILIAVWIIATAIAVQIITTFDP